MQQLQQATAQKAKVAAAPDGPLVSAPTIDGLTTVPASVGHVFDAVFPFWRAFGLGTSREIAPALNGSAKWALALRQQTPHCATQSLESKANANNICVRTFRHFTKGTIRTGAVLEPVYEFQIRKAYKRNRQLRT